jgi:membrane protein YdbS with pleckstrin-like domain
MTGEPPEQWRGYPPDDPDRSGAAGGDGESEPVDLSDADTQVLGRARIAGYPPDQPDGPADRPWIAPEELAGLQGDGPSPSAVRRVLPLEDEASNLVARYLFPTERYRGEWRRHLIHLATPITVGVLATFALGWLSGLAARFSATGWLSLILFLLWVAVMGWVGWRVADWHFDRFILTNKRVMKVSGIITRNVAMMPLLRVTDMKYEQTPLARMLNYGTFVLESAGQDQALREVPHLPNPNELYLRVVEEMYEPAAVEARMGGEGDESEEELRAGDS